jgi:hypothetical protein
LPAGAPFPVDELGARRGVYQLKGLSPKARETAMRTFLSAHWKSIVALILLVLLAILTMSPGAASAYPGARPRPHSDFASHVVTFVRTF